MSIIEFSARFLKSLEEKNESEIEQVCLDWTKELKNQPLWYSKNSGDEFWRCLWTEAENAFTEQKEIFNSPGLYFFGKDKEILYIGLTGQKLKKRLRKRYFGPKSPKSETPNKIYAQFKLAKAYEGSLKKNGYEALPEDVRSWYKHNYGENTKVRLIHAEKLAKEGIHNIWFGVLPLKKKEYIEQLETKLIKIENPRLNTQKK